MIYQEKEGNFYLSQDSAISQQQDCMKITITMEASSHECLKHDKNFFVTHDMTFQLVVLSSYLVYLFISKLTKIHLHYTTDFFTCEYSNVGQ